MKEFLLGYLKGAVINISLALLFWLIFSVSNYINSYDEPDSKIDDMSITVSDKYDLSTKIYDKPDCIDVYDKRLSLQYTNYMGFKIYGDKKFQKKVIKSIDIIRRMPKKNLHLEDYYITPQALLFNTRLRRVCVIPYDTYDKETGLYTLGYFKQSEPDTIWIFTNRSEYLTTRELTATIVHETLHLLFYQEDLQFKLNLTEDQEEKLVKKAEKEFRKYYDEFVN